jgi:hypothetical protein
MTTTLARKSGGLTAGQAVNRKANWHGPKRKVCVTEREATEARYESVSEPYRKGEEEILMNAIYQLGDTPYCLVKIPHEGIEIWKPIARKQKSL